MTLLRGLKASGLASLFLRSFSILERFCGSLLTRNVSVAESKVGRRGRYRSGDLRDPLILDLLSKAFNDARRNIAVLGRLFSRGSVEAPSTGFWSQEASSEGPSYLLSILNFGILRYSSGKSLESDGSFSILVMQSRWRSEHSPELRRRTRFLLSKLGERDIYFESGRLIVAVISFAGRSWKNDILRQRASQSRRL